VEVVESPNSCVVVEIDLDEIPSTPGVDFTMLHSLVIEVNPFHVIFYLYKILIIECFNKCSGIIILHLGLKNFFEKSLVQFQVYIWFIAHCHNVYNHLDKI
jgi:hypothetical protein